LPWKCIDSHFRREMAIEATHELFSGKEKPDAIFVGNDHMAFAVLETLKCVIGVRVPEDVSVIGFDDVEMSSWKMYDLTTLRQPVNRMVDATINMIVKMIEKQTVETRIEMQSDLMIRGSSRIPDGWPHALSRSKLSD
ncbi:MAG: substrate-binding domain-containing protein, partial [Gammaproteobacteria bacterium]|nr:substrate-binding domain-containing protein [Gammaproteobacteria bacterium]